MAILAPDGATPPFSGAGSVSSITETNETEAPTLPSSVWEEIVGTVEGVTDSVIDFFIPGPAPIEVATTPSTSTSSDNTAATPDPNTALGETVVPGTALPDDGAVPGGMGGGEVLAEVPTPPPGPIDSFTEAVTGVGDALADLIFSPAPGTTDNPVAPNETDEKGTGNPDASVTGNSADRAKNGKGAAPSGTSFSPLKTINSFVFSGSRAIDVTIDRVAVVLKHPFSATLTLAAPLLQVSFMLSVLHLGELIRFVPAFFSLGILTVRRKDRRYGIVFDALTGKPLAAATVSIRNESGSTQRIMSNGYGMYAALVPAGKYTLSVEKDGYHFPSKNPSQSLRPERPAYRANAIHQLTEPGMINLDLALDRTGLVERVPTALIASYRSNEKLLRVFADSLYYGGFTITIILTLIESSAFHFAFLLAYGLMFIFRQLGLARRDWGEVRYKTTKRAAHFASVKLLDSSGALARRTIADEYGRYYLFVEKGTHLLKYECEDLTLHKVHSLEKKIVMTEPIGMVTENVLV